MTAILSTRSVGEPVKALQTKLVELGYDTAGIDGHYGPATRRAVKDFQKSVSLQADGIAGPETLEALNDMVKAGKIRLFGCSNFSAAQLREAADVARDAGLESFVTAQNQWSVLDRGIERELVPACAENGVGLLPFYPLAKGLLTGKYRRDTPPPEGSRLASTGDLARADFVVLEALAEFATKRGHDLLTLAISIVTSTRLPGKSSAEKAIPASKRSKMPSTGAPPCLATKPSWLPGSTIHSGAARADPTPQAGQSPSPTIRMATIRWPMTVLDPDPGEHASHNGVLAHEVMVQCRPDVTGDQRENHPTTPKVNHR